MEESKIREICAAMPKEELKTWSVISAAVMSGNKKARDIYVSTFGEPGSMHDLYIVMQEANNAKTPEERAAEEARLTRELNCRASVNSPSDALLEKWKDGGMSNLTYYRKKAGMTQKALAEVSGVNTRQIQKIESGEIKLRNASAANVLALADALDVDPHELMDR